MKSRSSAKQRVLAMLIMVCSTLPLAAEPQTVGWLEGAYLQPWGVRVRAKLDTGAKTSTIHAENIKPYEKNGVIWVRFLFPYGRREGYPEGFVIERPLARQIRVKTDDGTTAPRYVIDLDVCISGKTQTTEVSLSDRGNMNYPMLLGRETLAGHFVIDSQQTFMGKRTCPRKLARKRAAK